MNLTRIISIKERIATSSDWKPDERDFILDCINVAIKDAKPRPDLSMEDFRIAVIALRKAAHTSHPEMARRERDIAYRIARLIPPAFSPDEVESRTDAFIKALPFTPPLFMSSDGDAAVHLVAQADDVVVIKWLASIHRGAGRAALTAMIEVADSCGIVLGLTAKPQPPMGAGKQMTPKELEAFYAGFGFVTTGRVEGFANMMREPKKGRQPGSL